MSRNPYIPLDVAQPSLHQMRQRSLRGPGLAERVEVCRAATAEFDNLAAGRAVDEGRLDRFFEILADDIKRERRRIGGDWAVAGTVDTRR